MKKTKVLVGGSFNLLHQGHVFFLQKAKELGKFLVVVIASDRTVLKNKGALILPAEKRKALVERLGIADRVRIGSDSDFFRVVEEEKPDVIAIGYDQKISKWLVKRIRSSFPKCRIVRIHSRLKGYSTSKMLKELGIKTKKGAKR